MKKGKRTTSSKKTSKNIKKVQQTHGKKEEKKGEFVPTTLDQIWGDDGTSRYKTVDEEVYLLSLNELTGTDLQTHATKVGVIPINNREMLTNRLLKEFRGHTNQYKKPTNPNSSAPHISKEVKDILSEGK